MDATVLLLADGRFPAGGHAHSGGIEWATKSGSVHDTASLAAFLTGVLATSGAVDAAVAAAVVARGADGAGVPWDALDAEVSARIASPALRRTSRLLGGQLARAAVAIWPAEPLRACAARSRDPGVHRAVALGATGAAAGLDAHAIALVAASSAVSGPAGAAVRLLGLDPLAVHAVLARLGPEIDGVAAEGEAAARDDLADLPALTAPWRELGAEEHARWEVRLFAS